jgi:hypothetical protein
MFSVETNSISFIGLAVDGEYSMINVPSELCNGVGDSGLRLSTAYYEHFKNVNSRNCCL